MDVKRYEGNDGSYLDHGTMYVLAKDFDALLAQRDALQGKLKVAVSHMRHPIGCYVVKLPTSGVSYTFTIGEPTAAPNCTCGLHEALAQIEGK